MTGYRDIAKLVLIWYSLTGACYIGGLFIYYYFLLDHVDVYPHPFVYILFFLTWPFTGFLLTLKFLEGGYTFGISGYTFGILNDDLFSIFNVFLPLITISLLVLFIILRQLKETHKSAHLYPQNVVHKRK